MAIYDKHFDGYRIFVGDLGKQVTRFDVEHEFERFGPLLDVWVARNPPGFAFLVFKYAEDCERAVRKCHGRVVCGRRVRVEYARPFDDRRPTRSGPSSLRRRSRSPYWSRRTRSRSPRNRRESSTDRVPKGRRLYKTRDQWRVSQDRSSGSTTPTNTGASNPGPTHSRINDGNN